MGLRSRGGLQASLQVLLLAVAAARQRDWRATSVGPGFRSQLLGIQPGGGRWGLRPGTSSDNLLDWRPCMPLLLMYRDNHVQLFLGGSVAQVRWQPAQQPKPYIAELAPATGPARLVGLCAEQSLSYKLANQLR